MDKANITTDEINREYTKFIEPTKQNEQNLANKSRMVAKYKWLLILIGILLAFGGIFLFCYNAHSTTSTNESADKKFVRMRKDLRKDNNKTTTTASVIKAQKIQTNVTEWQHLCMGNESANGTTKEYSKAECDLAKLLLNNMDFTKNPNDDFNLFVCPNYYSRTRERRSTSENEEELNEQTERQAEITYRALRSTIEGFCEQKLKRGGPFLMPIDRVLAYLRSEFGMFQRNSSYFTSAKRWSEFGIGDFWRRIGRAQQLFQTTDLINVIVQFGVNDDEYVMSLEQPPYPSVENDDFLLNLYLVHSEFNADLPFNDKIDVNRVLLFAVGLIDEIKNEADKQNPKNNTIWQKLKLRRTQQGKYWKLAELNREFTFIDVESLLEGMGIENLTKNRQIFVPNFEYLQLLNGLLSWMRPQYVLDFVGMRIIHKLHYISQLEYGSCFSDLFYTQYVENHKFMAKLNFTEAFERIEAAKKIGEKVFNAAKKLLNESWQIGDGFRQKALEKVNSIKQQYGWPSWYNVSTHAGFMLYYTVYVDVFTQLQLAPTHPDYYFHAYLALNAVKHRHFLWALQRTQEEIERYILASYNFASKAFYSGRFNKVYISYGAIGRDAFRPDFDIAIQYGSLGHDIGHEIGHAFDSTFFHLKYNGNDTAPVHLDMDKLDANTTRLIDELNACLVDKFERKCCIYNLEKGRITCGNGMGTLDENFADLFGTRVAYSAYLTEKESVNKTFHGLPGFQNLSQSQLFWIGQGLGYCSTYEMDLKRIAQDDAHSAHKCRTNTQFGNMPEFAADFDCHAPEDWMCREKGCNLWI